ncbi:uncharacterized protein B0T23DRAFT_374976 [Neurospora hispaniola]|uniref:Uncharacterized protein n=1 Tax=Neurospora hispaniola TaxID=588809 RepID=A0AAJ0IDH2_9PEZI|nr:hypothetical protein B0T23DRAFT_374976 [Neurospora hispaniola]
MSTYATPPREAPITFLCGHIFHKRRTYHGPTMQVPSVPSSLSGAVPPWRSNNAPVPCKLCRENKLWEYDWRRRVWMKKDNVVSENGKLEELER